MDSPRPSKNPSRNLGKDHGVSGWNLCWVIYMPPQEITQLPKGNGKKSSRRKDSTCEQKNTQRLDAGQRCNKEIHDAWRRLSQYQYKPVIKQSI